VQLNELPVLVSLANKNKVMEDTLAESSSSGSTTKKVSKKRGRASSTAQLQDTALPKTNSIKFFYDYDNIWLDDNYREIKRRKQLFESDDTTDDESEWAIKKS
jgi:hypothetical protein